MRRYLCLVLLFLSACSSPQVTERLEHADSLMVSNPDSAYKILTSLDLDELTSNHQKAYYGLLITQANYKTYRPITSDSLIFSSSLFYKKRSDEKYGKALYYLGAVHEDLGLYDTAIEDYKAALEALKNSTEYKTLALINCNLGSLYQRQFFPDQAMQHYLTAEKLLLKINDQQNLKQLYSLMGSTMRMKKEIDSALLLYAKSADISRRYNDTSNLALANINSAWCFVDQHNYSAAKKNINNSIIYQKGEVSAVQYLISSHIALNEKQFDSALYYIQRVPQTSSSAELKSEIYEKKGDYNSALQHFKQHHQYVMISLDKREKARVDEIEARYDNTKHILEKERLQELFILWSIISLLVIITLTVAVLFFRFRLRRKIMEHRAFVEALDNQNNNNALSDLISVRESALRKALEERLAVIGDLISIYYECGDNDKLFASKFKATIMRNPLQSKALRDIVDIVNKSYNNIIDHLKQQYPNLNSSELDICALTCVGFSTQQIFIILNLPKVEAVYYHKNRINTKLSHKGDLRVFLQDMSSNLAPKSAK